MGKKVAGCAYQEKIQSLFFQSYNLLSAARQLSDTPVRKFECQMKEPIEMARLAAINDLREIKIAQENTTRSTMKRLSSFQIQAELLLEEMGDDLQGNSHKMIDKARSHLTTWLEDTRSLVHKGEKIQGDLRKISQKQA